MDEIWKDIPGYEGMYQVSDLGRVKSVSRKDARGRNRKERILQNNPNASGHHQVKLYKDGNTKYPYVHRMVLEAFVGPPPKEKPNALHCDDDPSNNKLENLRWGVHSVAGGLFTRDIIGLYERTLSEELGYACP